MNQFHLSSVFPRRRTVGLRTHSRAGRVCAVAVTTLMLLSGCAGSPGEEESPKAGESPAVSASPTPTVAATPTPAPTPVYGPASAEGPAENVPLPKLPAEAKEETEAGLEAFAKYWYDTVEYAFETGDLEPLKQISGPNCFACKGTYEVVTNGYANDDYIDGGEFTIHATDSSFSLTSEDRYQIVIQSGREAVTYYAGPKQRLGAEEAVKSATQILEASFHDGAWTAVNVETLQS